MSIQISAIICTFNREQYLHKAIQSLVEQTLETELYEIIVVDNHSTDNTKKIVTEEFAHIPNLRYIYEPVLGLSQARNTGWQNAKGEYIAYLDDDAIASPTWLENIIQVFESIIPTPGGVGGKIEPIWEAERPSWLPDRLLPWLTILDWSENPIFLTDYRYIAGANMAFPRFLIEKVGGFQVDLGRKGKKLLSNEELLLRTQIQSHGYKIYYDPKIAVKHHVPASRLTQAWFIKRNFWQGVSEATFLIYQNSPSFWSRCRLAFTESRDLFKSPRLLINLIILSPNSNRFDIKCKLLTKLGFIWKLFHFTG